MGFWDEPFWWERQAAYEAMTDAIAEGGGEERYREWVAPAVREPAPGSNAARAAEVVAEHDAALAELREGGAR